MAYSIILFLLMLLVFMLPSMASTAYICAAFPLFYMLAKWTIGLLFGLTVVNILLDVLEHRKARQLEEIDNKYRFLKNNVEMDFDLPETTTEPPRRGWRRSRKYDRFEVDGCWVNTRRTGLFEFTRKWIAGELTDLSMSGASFRVVFPVKKGHLMRILINVPAFKHELVVSGKVVRVERENFGSHLVAVRFYKMDEYSRSHLQALKQYDCLREASKILEKRDDESDAT